MDSFIRDNSIKVVRFVDCHVNKVYAGASKSNILLMEENKMKNWNAAEIEELNIAETANGIFPFCKEFCIIFDGPNNNNNNNNNENEEEGSDKGDNVTTDTLS